MSSYSLEEIENIFFKNQKYKLPEKTLNILKEIELKVGSPNYIKTPIFKNKKSNYYGEDWNSIRSFKKTTIKETNNKLEEVITQIRNVLNKLTKETFEENCDMLLDIIDNNELSQENMYIISKLIFDIASQNAFYSEIYAEMYRVLMTKYEIMIDMFNKNLNDFIKIFDIIDYVNPEQDYDKFCIINKQNEERKSLSKFFVNLMNLDMISETTIINIILKLQNKIKELCDDKNKKNHIDELSENLFILITLSYNNIKNDKVFLKIFENIKTTSELNRKQHPGISNKSIFKHMDIIDYINELNNS
jgi:hypothetical protein